jgi:hypothetical protein
VLAPVCLLNRVLSDRSLDSGLAFGLQDRLGHLLNKQRNPVSEFEFFFSPHKLGQAGCVESVEAALTPAVRPSSS